ncbi:MAG: class I SAM-dependent methyltransferase [Halobacteriota archaeon]
MQHDKIKIDLSTVSETLLISLWSRAKISREHNSLLNDAKAIELVEQIDYDFSIIDKALRVEGTLLDAARARQFDDKIKAYIAEHPYASVVNIGAGLDTHFYRNDNGTIHWYDLDLPSVIEMRKQLLPEPDRATYIPKSFLDPSWCKDVKQTEDGVFMIAGGVLMYFEEAQVRQFFSLLADHFPSGEIIFDGVPKLNAFFGSLGLRRTGIKGVRIKWGIKDANKMTQWDNRIKVIEQFPCFQGIPRDLAWDKSIKRLMDLVDKSKMANIFHLQV